MHGEAGVCTGMHKEPATKILMTHSRKLKWKKGHLHRSKSCKSCKYGLYLSSGYPELLVCTDPTSTES